MSTFVNIRRLTVGGGIADDAYALTGDALAGAKPALRSMLWPEWQAAVNDRHLLLAIHGFNVSYRNGARAAARLDSNLALGDDYLVAGVLWPGDWWIPAVNYPAEAKDAVACGRRLAAFINRWCGGARSVSLASHSLGGRVLLETLVHLQQPAAMACLTAAAVDDDVFVAQYWQVVEKAGRIFVLASRRDKVLKLAYPAGDFMSDVLYDNDNAFARALGRRGSRPPRATDSQIPDIQGYDHGHYFPDADHPPVAGDKWLKVSDFIKRCLLNQTHTWP